MPTLKNSPCVMCTIRKFLNATHAKKNFCMQCTLKKVICIACGIKKFLTHDMCFKKFSMHSMRVTEIPSTQLGYSKIF